MKIQKLSGDCGGFRPPKGHMDTQMFPECEGTQADRDIVKKTRNKRKKNKSKKHKSTKKRKNVHARVEVEQVDIEVQPQECYCSNCGVCMGNMTKEIWVSKGETCDACSGRLVKAPTPPLVPEEMPLAAAVISEKSLVKVAEGDVWQLESEDEEFASHMLSQIVNKALEGDTGQQQFLTNLWDGESWESIKSKVLAEGSTWYVWWMDGVRSFKSQLDTSDVEASTCSCGCNIVEAKKKGKKKEWDPNPWAVCHTTVDKDKDPEKFERCVKKVKKNQAFNLSKIKKEANMYSQLRDPNAEVFLTQEIQRNWDNLQISQAIKALGEESIAGFSGVTAEDVPDILPMLQLYVLGEIKEWLSRNVGTDMVHRTVEADGGFSGNEQSSFAVTDVTGINEECPCRFCDSKTINTGTRLCNTCWMIKEYLEKPISGGDKEYVYKLNLQTNPELVEQIKACVTEKNN